MKNLANGEPVIVQTPLTKWEYDRVVRLMGNMAVRTEGALIALECKIVYREKRRRPILYASKTGRDFFLGALLEEDDSGSYYLRRSTKLGRLIRKLCPPQQHPLEQLARVTG